MMYAPNWGGAGTDRHINYLLSAANSSMGLPRWLCNGSDYTFLPSWLPWAGDGFLPGVRVRADGSLIGQITGHYVMTVEDVPHFIGGYLQKFRRRRCLGAGPRMWRPPDFEVRIDERQACSLRRRSLRKLRLCRLTFRGLLLFMGSGCDGLVDRDERDSAGLRRNLGRRSEFSAGTSPVTLSSISPNLAPLLPKFRKALYPVIVVASGRPQTPVAGYKYAVPAEKAEDVGLSDGAGDHFAATVVVFR